MATAPGKSRITELDGIRAIAIGMVFLNHLFHVRLMWAGVDMFFILSGFLITGILIAAKHRTIGDYFRHFYARRARRILPPYLMLLLVTALFFGVSWLRWAYMYLFLMNAMQPGTSQPTNLNILWSLAIEEQFYMFWPLVVFFLSETAIAWTAGSIVILVPLLRFFCTPYVTFFHIYQWTIFRMDLMALGALFAVLWRRRRNLFVRWGVYGPLLTGGALFAMLVLSRRPGFSTGSNLRLPNLLIYEFTLLGGAGMVLWALGGRLTAPLRWAWVGFSGASATAST